MEGPWQPLLSPDPTLASRLLHWTFGAQANGEPPDTKHEDADPEGGAWVPGDLELSRLPLGGHSGRPEGPVPGVAAALGPAHVLTKTTLPRHPTLHFQQEAGRRAGQGSPGTRYGSQKELRTRSPALPATQMGQSRCRAGLPPPPSGSPRACPGGHALRHHGSPVLSPQWPRMTLSPQVPRTRTPTQCTPQPPLNLENSWSPRGRPQQVPPGEKHCQ